MKLLILVEGKSHSTGLRYVNAVSKFSNAIPILIPSYIKGKDLDLLLKKSMV